MTDVTHNDRYICTRTKNKGKNKLTTTAQRGHFAIVGIN
jgi:hypothetical protein